MFESNLEYWKNKQPYIRKNKQTNRVLIEIAAQHPLKDGKEPGAEFEARLLRAIELYKEEVEKGNEVIFYIPGSRHYITKGGEKIEDLIPLADAGRNYLIKQGINPQIIHGSDANIKYKGDKGVYNSGDECYVANKLYEDEKCGRLLSVVSPVQVFRKGMFYNEFGIQPEIHSVPLENTFHNYIGELFWSLYVTTFIDHDWQGDESFLSVLTRVERCMGYECNIQEKDTLKNKRISIPKDIMKIKDFLMDKYNIAKENMQKNNSFDSILIQVQLSENVENEISEVIKLCKQQQKIGKNVSVTAESEQAAMQISSKLQQEDISGIDIKVTNRNADEFLDNEYKSLYYVCPADQVMKNAVSSIYQGVLPLIVAVPGQNDNYIEKTFGLYEEIIGKDLINQSNNPNVEKVSRKDLINGLLGVTDTGIDAENLPDLESYITWSNNYIDGEHTEGEERGEF